MSNDLEMDDETLEAVSSDTRKEILRALKERNMTVTELSNRLDLSKSTVHEHLSKLLEASFINKLDEDGKKWVYYELTKKGKKLVGNRVKKVLLFATSGIASVLGIHQLATYLNISQDYLSQDKTMAIQEETADAGTEAMQTTTEAAEGDIHLLVAVILLIVAISAFLYYLKKVR